MHKKIIFISRELQSKNGASIVGLRNKNLIESYFSNSSVKHFVFPKLDFLKNILNLITLKFLNYDKLLLNEVVKFIKFNEVEYVFIDSSLFGGAITLLKSKFKNIKFVTFFHNCEYHYFHQNKASFITYKLKLYYSFINEKISWNKSDLNFFLTQRDIDFCKNIYGNNTSQNIILPLGIDVNYKKPEFDKGIITNKFLFVGSNFYANKEGLEWFCFNVLPELSQELVVIGKGFDYLKVKFKNIKNLNVIGFVDDLEKYYLESDFVINPVGIGSGMKTKTAEALLYGKHIISKPEGFIGYYLDSDIHSFDICLTKEDFLNSINSFYLNPLKYSNENRKYFDLNLSNQAISIKINKVLNNFQNV
jgi:polysaccharide biosynthesis protein PslH